MGIWGAGAFDNDAAGDWTDQLQEAGELLVENTLQQVNDSGSTETDSDLCCAAIAAAEVVAASRGWPVRGLPDEVADWVAESGYVAKEPSAQLALQVVRVVQGETELAELMAAEKAWRRKLQQLEKRLANPERPKGRPKSPHLRLTAQAKAAIKQFKSSGAYIVAKEAYFDFASARDVQSIAPQLAEFRRIEYLNLERSNITDQGLEVLQHVQRMDRLRLLNTSIGDAGMASIAHLRSLTHLELEGTRITDSGFALLSQLSELRYLGLNRTRLSGNAADTFASFHRLEHLWMERTGITDQAISRIASLPSLEVLSLANTSITDQGLLLLENLQRIKTLIVAGTGITDAGLRPIGRLFRPREDKGKQAEAPADYCVLRLENTSISDEGLKFLHHCLRLKFVDLRRTRVTDAGAAALQATLPDAEILHG